MLLESRLELGCRRGSAAMQAPPPTHLGAPRPPLPACLLALRALWLRGVPALIRPLAQLEAGAAGDADGGRLRVAGGTARVLVLAGQLLGGVSLRRRAGAHYCGWCQAPMGASWQLAACYLRTFFFACLGATLRAAGALTHCRGRRGNRCCVGVDRRQGRKRERHQRQAALAPSPCCRAGGSRQSRTGTGGWRCRRSRTARPRRCRGRSPGSPPRCRPAAAAPLPA